MFHEIPPANRKRLREFGFVTGIGLILIFGLFLPWIKGHSAPTFLWVLSAILIALGAIAPMTLRPAYYLWMRFGAILGWINSRIILGIVFYGLVFPIGLLFKAMKKDPMERQFDRQRSSYRKKSALLPPSRMENPY